MDCIQVGIIFHTFHTDTLLCLGMQLKLLVVYFISLSIAEVTGNPNTESNTQLS